jgi:hypothetical protein
VGDKDYAVAYGWTVVANMQGCTGGGFEVAKAKELAVLQKLGYSSSQQKNAGIEAVARRMVEMLTKHIKTNWAKEAKGNVQTLLSKVKVSLDEMGCAPPDKNATYSEKKEFLRYLIREAFNKFHIDLRNQSSWRLRILKVIETHWKHSLEVLSRNQGVSLSTDIFKRDEWKATRNDLEQELNPLVCKLARLPANALRDVLIADKISGGSNATRLCRFSSLHDFLSHHVQSRFDHHGSTNLTSMQQKLVQALDLCEASPTFGKEYLMPKILVEHVMGMAFEFILLDTLSEKSLSTLEQSLYECVDQMSLDCLIIEQEAHRRTHLCLTQQRLNDIQSVLNTLSNGVSVEDEFHECDPRTP